MTDTIVIGIISNRESELLKNLDFNDLINKFAYNKSRKNFRKYY